MKPEQRGGTGAGPVDPGLAHRVEGLVDEAVALAAKGSYREAAARAEQARELDPENRVAHDLVASYRRLAQDDDERRRRRRSIAAAAAAIEEMIEVGRLEEAATAVEALSLQYGVEAPVDELRARIAVARANDEDFEELDAAIDAIRRPASPRAATPPRLDAVGTLAAEIEDHLRAGRLEEASGRLDKLEAMPGSEERLHKLRTRIEEARHVADEHRREEEILIATAAIEERIRRGSIEEAAERLEALASRHGSSAPIAELRQRLQEARDVMPAAGAPAVTSAAAAARPSAASTATLATRVGATERTGEFLGDDRPGITEDAAFDAALADSGDVAATASGRGKRMALAAAAVVAIVAVGWWLTRASPEAAPTAKTSTAEVASAAGAETPGGDSAAADVTGGGAADGAVTSSPRIEAPAVSAETSASGAASSAIGSPPTDSTAASAPTGAPEAVEAPSPAAATGEAADLDAAGNPEPAASADTALDAGPSEAAPGVLPDEAPAVDSAPATTELTPAEPAAADTAADNRAEVVVDALPAGAEAAVPLPEQSAPEEPQGESPEVTAAPPPAESQPDDAGSVVASAQSAPPPAPLPASPARPVLLGCGEPGVVCVKPVRVPQPSYPPIARQRRLSASVVVFALVDETGRVIETRIDQGAAMRFFNDAAEEAARRAVFQPATRGGVPGRSWARLAFQFAPR